jgi:hypothetical protein
MSISMFVTGFVIFSLYLAIMIWNIYNGHKVEKKERQLDNQADQLDMDGMGNFSRFPAAKED